MDYGYLVKRAYDTACKQGYHDDPQTPLTHWLMMVITEVAELVEADQMDKHAQVEVFKQEIATPLPAGSEQEYWRFCFERFVKDTIEDEMADICIRLFDLAGLLHYEPSPQSEYDVLFSPGSPCTEYAYLLCKILLQRAIDVIVRIYIIDTALAFVMQWADYMDIDLEWHIMQKMAYNDTRERLHGKKY